MWALSGMYGSVFSFLWAEYLRVKLSCYSRGYRTRVLFPSVQCLRMLLFSRSVVSDFATTWTIQYSRLYCTVHGISRPEYWSGSLPFSRGSSQPRDRTQVQTFGPLKILLSYWVLRIRVYLWYESFIMCFTNIFSPSVACAFLLLTVSFMGRHF